MLPELIPHFGIGPFFGFAANAVMAVLCLVTMALYLQYRPLRSLFLFYLFLTFCFLGWVVYGLQKTPESILLGYRIDYAALAVLPACWVWFVTALFNERIDWLTWAVTGISLTLAALALFGQGLYLFGLPLEPDPVASIILRPQSKLLRPLIQYFCLMVCLFYFLLIMVRLWRSKDRRPAYLLPLGFGLFFWFLGGLHDAARSIGVAILIKEQVLWFTSLWLSIFLTIAVAFHFRSLEQTTRQELQRLNKAKSKALDHLSHELKTPLAVIQGKIRLLKRELQYRTSVAERETFFETLEKHLRRLLDIQQETDKIIRSYQELEKSLTHDEIDRHASFETIFVLPFAELILDKVRQRATHRNLHIDLEGARDLWVWMDPRILEDILEGLLKNAIENTPDEGLIRILVEQKGQRLLLKVQDFGVGITEEDQEYLFDGLFHTQETELYASKSPYDFNAGGKGLDLLRMKSYEQHLGFDLSVVSRRCLHLLTGQDPCPGRISACPYCKVPEDCQSSGGSTFSVSFPVLENKRSENANV